MSLVAHAKHEMELAGLYDKDSDYGGLLPKSVLELVEVFSKQGHSGTSASIVMSLFDKVAAFECLSPLTGKDEEWMDVGDNCFQNKRVSGVFKEKKTGRAYYLDAISWRLPTGSQWHGSADDIRSRQFIKSFPFTPKSFVIDVTEEQIGKDDYLFHIKNKEDLKPIAEYYDFPLPKTE